MPMRTPIRSARKASSSVIGSLLTIVSLTGMPRLSVPRSPWAARAAPFAYWTGRGSLRPYLSRMAPSTLGSRFSEAKARAGSPGRARTPAKTTMLASKTTIRAAPALRRMKTPMIVAYSLSSGLFGVVGPDQAVAEGLNTFHVLADTVAVDRMPEVDQRELRAEDLEH